MVLTTEGTEFSSDGREGTGFSPDDHEGTGFSPDDHEVDDHEGTGISPDDHEVNEIDTYTPRSLISKARMQSNTSLIQIAHQTEGERAICLAAAILTTPDDGDPTSYEEAMASEIREQWIDATLNEWTSLIENETFELIDEIPPGIKPIGSRWVYKLKRNADGSFKPKVRLVIKGYQQTPGIDFGETYAPVSKLASFRMLLAISTAYGWDIHHMDVVTAFLNPPIDNKNVYMSMPPGVRMLDKKYNDKSIVRLRKALYGLKQAPRLWHEHINNFLLSIGFDHSSADPNLYLLKNPPLLLLLYVDDILICGNHVEAIKDQLQRKYKMKDLGIAQRFLGIEIARANGITSICQRDYINSVAERFQMKDARSVLSPMDPDVDLGNLRCQDKAADKELYISLIGSLMYIALATRPDIAFAITALSRYNEAPLQMHLTAAKRVLRYLKTTVNHQLHLGYKEQPVLEGFTDSDWAGCKDKRKSTSGYVFFSYGGPISWQAKGQTVVALSTLEAEYIACSNAVREAIWLRRLLSDIEGRKEEIMEPVEMRCDNQGALKLIETGVLKSKTKHIDIKFHHTHDEQKQGRVRFRYVTSKENPADLFTKALNRPRHMEVVKMIGLKERN